jgi:hypothetical protein
MSALFVRTRRPKFVKILGRYWDAFLSTWNVMLHGNPVVNVYGGIKLAASGELGMGVGEEDRGSSEREVLEGFVGRIDGLIDVVVSKFGDVEPDAEAEKGSKESSSQHRMASSQQWLGTGAEPTSEDGAIFLGVGALSRKSLRDVTHWMEDIYSWGSLAYGVAENPTSIRKSRKKNKVEKAAPENASSDTKSPKNPLDGVNSGASETHSKSPIEAQPPVAPISPEDINSREARGREIRPSLQRGRSSQSSVHSVTTGGKIASYFKLGYATHWILGAKSSHENVTKASERETQVPHRVANSSKAERAQPGTEVTDPGSDSSVYPRNDSVGHFLIGLMGNIEDEGILEMDHNNTTADEATGDRGDADDDNFRTLLRTVTVELEREGDARAEAEISIDLSMENEIRSSKHGGSERTGTSHTSFESQDRNKTKKLRVVVYVHRPFIFTFLFELRTDALALLGLYHSLHQQLRPLLRSLVSSTNHRLSRPEVTTSTAEAKASKTPIYDLIWDPKLWTITSTIPNIPEPSHPREQATNPAPWSRIEALNTHMQLLSTFAETRNDRSQLERTCKTSRGWWVVWTRIPDLNIDSSIRTIPSVVPSPHPGPSTPLLKPEDSTETRELLTGTPVVTDSATNRSMNSGSAHPFLEQANGLPEVMPKDKEILLVRRASDHTEKTPSRFVSTNSVTGETGWGSGTAKLAQGIGVDTKRYIEGLLNMNR